MTPWAIGLHVTLETCFFTKFPLKCGKLHSYMCTNTCNTVKKCMYLSPDNYAPPSIYPFLHEIDISKDCIKEDAWQRSLILPHRTINFVKVGNMCT